MKNSNEKNITVNTNNKPVINSNNELKNTIANDSNAKNVFSSADLWNIHKTVRTAYSRRRTFIG
jgi:hypothetical protein